MKITGQYIQLGVEQLDAGEDAAVVELTIHVMTDEAGKLQYRADSANAKPLKTPLPAIKKALRIEGYNPDQFYLKGDAASPNGVMSALRQLNEAVSAAAEREFEEARGHNSTAMDEPEGLDDLADEDRRVIIACVSEAGRLCVELEDGDNEQFLREFKLAHALKGIAGAVGSSQSRAKIYEQLKARLRSEDSPESRALLQVYESKNLPATLIRLASLSSEVLVHRPPKVRTARTVMVWFDEQRQALASRMADVLHAYRSEAANLPLADVADVALRTAISDLMTEAATDPLHRTMLRENMALPSFKAWYDGEACAFKWNDSGDLVLKVYDNGLPIVESLYVNGRGDAGNELMRKFAQYASEVFATWSMSDEAEDSESEEGDDVESVVDFASMSEEEQAGEVIAFLAGKLGIAMDDAVTDGLAAHMANVASWMLDGLDHMRNQQLTTRQLQADLVGGAVEPYTEE